MVDYRKATGSLGTGFLIIRVTTGKVEFLIENGSSSTHVGTLRWSGVVNGKSVSGTKSITGKGTFSLNTWNATTTQKVTFKIEGTGTQGLGGPTTFEQTINGSGGGADGPPAPKSYDATDITHTGATIKFTSNGNGGSAITKWETAVGTDTDPNKNPKYTSNGTLVLTGQQPGTQLFFQSRGHNAKGPGPWNTRRNFTTLAGVKIKVSGVWKNAVPYVKTGGVWKPAIPFIKVSGAWKSTKA